MFLDKIFKDKSKLSVFEMILEIWLTKHSV